MAGLLKYLLTSAHPSDPAGSFLEEKKSQGEVLGRLEKRWERGMHKSGKEERGYGGLDGKRERESVCGVKAK